MKSKKVIYFLLDENGQGMVEYGLIIALIALAAVLALGIFGNAIKEQLYDKVIDSAP